MEKFGEREVLVWKLIRLRFWEISGEGQVEMKQNPVLSRALPPPPPGGWNGSLPS